MDKVLARLALADFLGKSWLHVNLAFGDSILRWRRWCGQVDRGALRRRAIAVNVAFGGDG